MKLIREKQSVLICHSVEVFLRELFSAMLKHGTARAIKYLKIVKKTLSRIVANKSFNKQFLTTEAVTF